MRQRSRGGGRFVWRSVSARERRAADLFYADLVGAPARGVAAAASRARGTGDAALFRTPPRLAWSGRAAVSPAEAAWSEQSPAAVPSPAAPPIIPVFPGLDIEAWFGELVWLWRWSNLRFIGFYLAHHRTNNQTTWTDHWHDLQDVGWGLVPFYLPFADTEIAQMAAADGAAHGRHAVANARRARLERGAAIYLDIETQVLGEANDAGFMRYINNWFAAVRAGGYTPGTYCSNLDASRILGPDFRASRPVLFPFSIPRRTRAVWDDANHQLTPPLPATWDVLRDPAWAGNANTIGSQYDWFNSTRDPKGFHWATATGGAGALRNADWDVAKVWDPSHPRAAATLAIAADRDVRHAHRVFTVKTDRVELRERATMAPIPATARNLELGPADIGPVPRATESGYDAASAAACSRRGGCTDLFLQGQDGIIRTIWRTDRETFPRHGWPLHPEPARRGSPIAAVSRELDQIDVFYISRQHQLVTQWWHPSAADWPRNRRVIAGPLVAGGSNLAVVGRGASGSPPSQLDVFYVSLDYSRPYAAPAKWNDAWQVVHASWAQATDWTVRPIRDLVQPAAASGVAAARDPWGRLDLVMQTRDRRELKHATLDPASGAWTVAAGPGPLPADGDRPMWWMSFGLAVFERVLLLVGITSSGALAWATHTPGVWSRVELDAAPFTAGRPVALAHRGGGYLDVVGLTEDGDFETRTLEVLKDGRVILLPVR